MTLFEIRSATDSSGDRAGDTRALRELDSAGIAVGGERDSLVWVRISVPPDAEPGTYRGHIRLDTADGPSAYFPMMLRVREPTLPDLQQRAIGLEVWQSWTLMGQQQDLTAFSEPWWRLADDYVASLAGLGTGATQVGRAFCDWRRVAPGQWQFDFSRLDRFLRLCRDRGLTGHVSYLGMFSTSGPTQIHYLDADGQLQTLDTQPGEELYDEAWSAFAQALARHCRIRGCFGDLYIWPADRPATAEQIAHFVHAANILRAADAGYRIAVTVDNAEAARQLAGHVDRLVLPLHGPSGLAPALVEELKAMGKQVWGYLEEGVEHPGLSSGLPAVHAYAVGPLAYVLQLDGVLTSTQTGTDANDEADRAVGAGGRATLLYVTDRVQASLEAELLLLGLQDAELLRMAGRQDVDQWLGETGVTDDWTSLGRHAEQLRGLALTRATRHDAEP